MIISSTASRQKIDGWDHPSPNHGSTIGPSLYARLLRLRFAGDSSVSWRAVGVSIAEKAVPGENSVMDCTSLDISPGIQGPISENNVYLVIINKGEAKAVKSLSTLKVVESSLVNDTGQILCKS